jgi:hypothetical protein
LGPVAIPIRLSASVFRWTKTAQKKSDCSPKDISQPSAEVAAAIAAQTASSTARISE